MPRRDDLFTEKRGGIDLVSLVKSAAEEGIGAISEAHPRFSPEFLAQYLDPKKLDQYAHSIAKKAGEYQEQGRDPRQVITQAYKTLAAKIASGKLFDNKGKEIILGESWQKKSRGWFGGGTAREVLDGEKYLDEAMRSMRDVYKLMKSGDYVRKFPELAKALDDLDNLGFAYTASSILYKNGQLDEGKYTAFRRALAEKTRQKVGQTKAYLDHAFSQSLAAAVLAIVGLGIFLSTNSITGNVIGTTIQTNIIAIFSGLGALILGMYFLIKVRHS
jgi:hypothetical protein